MTIAELKDAYKYKFNKPVEAAYFKPEEFSLIGDNMKSLFQSKDSYVLSHGTYLLISKNEEERYGFWSLSQYGIKNFTKKQLNRNKEQSWIKHALNIFAQYINRGIDIPFGFDIFVWGNLSVTEDAGTHIEALISHALSQQLGLKLNSAQTETKFDSEYKLVISNTHTPHVVSQSPLAMLTKENRSLVEEYLSLENKLTQDALIIFVLAYTAALGRLINRNYQILRDKLHVVPPEIELMIADAQKIEGVLGIRMTGCGFGGNTIALIKESAIPVYVEQMSEIHEFETDVKTDFYTANIGDDIFKHYEFE